jgi:hypothetical protein
MIKHVGTQEQNSTNMVFLGSWRCRMWITSGVKRKVVSEMLRKYDVCVWSKMMYLTPPRQSTNPEDEISYANLGPKTEK